MAAPVSYVASPVAPEFALFVYLLLSHCNTEQARLFGLSVFNIATGTASWLDLAATADLDPSSDNGITGLARSSGRIYAAVQGSREGKVLVFDETMNYLHTVRLHGPCDVHSILIEGDSLYYTATRESRLMRHDLASGRNEPVWEAPAYIHLNDVKRLDGELHVLSQSSQHTPGCTRGVLYNLQQGTAVVDNLLQPHTIFQDGESLFLLNSMEGECLVRETASAGFRHFCRVPGYARGMARVNESYFIGVSASRLFSRKQGISTGYFADGEPYYGQDKYLSFLARVDRSTGAVTLLHYSAYNFEIYDVLPLEEPPKALVQHDAAAVKAQFFRMRLYRQQLRLQRLRTEQASREAAANATAATTAGMTAGNNSDPADTSTAATGGILRRAIARFNGSA